MATTEAVGYARRALNHAKTGWVDIKIDHMRRQDAQFWDTYIQPVIRREAANQTAAGGALGRADHHWRWTPMRMLLPLTQLLQARRCRALSILVQNSEGNAVPAGMLLLIEQYPWPVVGAAVTRSVFTWFLTSAPAEALASLSVPEPPSLGRILIDTALVTSKALGLDGQMWLHAAPGGGDRLAHFYGTICHMPAFPVGMALPGRRRSDGRYFYATRSLANQLVQALKLVR
jgi:hypothetical protein